MKPSVIYFTDCTDPNALSRITSRFSAVMGDAIHLFPLEGEHADLVAGHNLLDAIQARQLTGLAPSPGAFAVNVAQRGNREDHENGVPFCYFYAQGNLVVSTLCEPTLSLAKKFLGVDTVRVVDIRTVLKTASTWNEFSISDERAEWIASNQFRSLWFVPLLINWLRGTRAVEIPYDEYPLAAPGISPLIWNTDNFGNCKTTVLPEEAGFQVGKILEVLDGEGVPMSILCYGSLTDVPNHQPGLVPGSNLNNFLELVIQRGNAAKAYNHGVGKPLFSF